MNITSVLVPTYMQMLDALSSWLKLTQKQLPEAEAQALLSARLAPDMFPLSTQIRFACVQALEPIYRLRREPFPPLIKQMLEEGRHAGEKPGSFDDAYDRIDDTIGMLGLLPGNGLDLHAGEPLAHELPNGMIFDLYAEQYARDWSLPQFYFHVVTAYAILRAHNVQIGKKDYVAHMFPYLREGHQPPGHA